MSNHKVVTTRDHQAEIDRPGCSFCLIPQTKTTESFKKIHGNLSHTLNIPSLPRNWTVLQDVAPIAETGGHLLLMPNQHRISLATVENYNEVTLASGITVSALQQYFPHQQIFFFEHGPGFIEGEQIACGGCHLDHAHGHLLVLPEGTALLPIQEMLERMLADAGWDLSKKIRRVQPAAFSDLPEITGINPYLHIGMINPQGAESITYIQRSLSQVLESQLMRHVVSAAVYDKPEPQHWHWRDITEGFVPDTRIQEIQQDVIRFREITGF